MTLPMIRIHRPERPRNGAQPMMMTMAAPSPPLRRRRSTVRLLRVLIMAFISSREPPLRSRSAHTNLAEADARNHRLLLLQILLWK